MRPIYECPENFPESLSTSTRLLFPKFLMGFCSDRSCECAYKNLKFVALPVPEIIGGTPKIWAVPAYAHAPFSPKILRAFVRMDLAKFEVRSWDNSDWRFWWRLRTLNLGEARERRGWGIVPLERALVISYRPFIVTFRLSLHVSDMLPQTDGRTDDVQSQYRALHHTV